MSLADKASKLVEKAKANQGKPVADVAKTLFGGKAPYGTTGPVGRDSAGYSFSRALGFAAGKLTAADCKEELEVSHRLKQLFPAYELGTSYNTIAIPYCTKSLLNVPGYDDRTKFVSELRQKMAATSEGEVDYDYVARLREKNFGTQLESEGGSLRGFPIQSGEIIDLQRANELMSRCGVREVTLGYNGYMSIPKQTGGSTAHMVGEEIAGTDSRPSTATLKLVAKKMLVLVHVTQEALEFTNPSSEALIRNDMAKVAARKVDQQCLYGAGTATEVKGLLTYNTTSSVWSEGVQDLLLYAPSRTGTDGWFFLPQDVDAMIARLPDELPDSGLGWMMRKQIYYNLINRRADAVSANDNAGPFVTDLTRSISDKPNTASLRGNNVYYSATILNNRTKGSGSNLSQAVVGDWQDFFLARFGVMTIEVSNQQYFNQDLVTLKARQFFDAAPARASSFVLFNDIING